MSNENNVYKKSNTKSEKMSRRFYSIAKAREPWYLKLIFWVLLIILLGGGSVTSFIIIKKHRNDTKAVNMEIDISEKLATFENEIMNENDKIVEKKFEVAEDIAEKNMKLRDEIEDLLNYYFKTFNNEIEGYNKVVDHSQKFETLKQEFNELNKDDSRLTQDNQTQPY